MKKPNKKSFNPEIGIVNPTIKSMRGGIMIYLVLIMWI